jgi:hypothetical protein
LAAVAPTKGRGAYQGPGCPKCGCFLPDAIPREGNHACWQCGLQFYMIAFDAPLPPQAPARLAEALGSAPCARHARNQAVASCERCGAFMCGLCSIDADDKKLCAGCFERLGSAGELADTRKGYRHYNGMAVHLCVFGILIWPLAILLGPLAIATALRGLKQSERFGETLGQGGARVAIGLGALETLGAALGVLALVGAFK